MILDKEKIIKICSDNLTFFTKCVKTLSYKKGGIFNSEMLLFYSLVKYFGVKLIIESGRANGQSTKILAECFNDPEMKIHSIEFEKFNPKVKSSFKRLKDYKNLNLHFGNSFSLIPKLITKNCCILIDGPKRIGAINLAIELLKNPLVKAVFIHDLHRDSPFRELAENIFKDCFFTDDYDYVQRFKFIDKNN